MLLTLSIIVAAIFVAAAVGFSLFMLFCPSTEEDECGETHSRFDKPTNKSHDPKN